MSKIVVFTGSPRKNGFSAQLLSKVIEGAEASGAEVVAYDLNDDGIRGCQSCFYCRANEGCATKDTLQPMYQDIKEADGIVVTLPIYFYSISGQAKTWIDRLYPMMAPDFSARYPGKKIVAIYAQGNADLTAFQASIEGTNQIFKLFGWDIAKTFVVGDTSNPEKTIDETLQAEAYEAGKQLV